MADTALKDNEVKNKSDPNKKSKRIPKHSTDYIVRRRCPPHATKKKNDIYVTSSADFRGQLSQCMKLIENGETEIIIHGLGGAIPQAVNLALQLHERLMDTFEIATSTDTVDVVDDLEPLVDELEGDTRVRSNSSVYIKLFKRSVEVN